MKNDVINLVKNYFAYCRTTWEKLLHARCLILGVVSRPRRQIGGLGKLNTCCLSCVFIGIVATWVDWFVCCYVIKALIAVLAANCNMRCCMPLDSGETGVSGARGRLKNCCFLFVIIFIALIDESMTVPALHLTIEEGYF